jgi:hypothetical protein
MTRTAPEPIAVATDWRPDRAAIEAIVAVGLAPARRRLASRRAYLDE